MISYLLDLNAVASLVYGPSDALFFVVHYLEDLRSTILIT